MANKNADISQIKKYLEGKLDTRAMYELERRALDDPFLMDAMEGFEAAGSQESVAPDLDALLQARLQKPQAKVISMRVLAMAASVIAVLTVGGWWLFSRPAVEQGQVIAKAEADKTVVSPSPLAQVPQIAINKDSLLAVNTPKPIIRSARKYAPPASRMMKAEDAADMADETAELASSSARVSMLAEESAASVAPRAKSDSVPLNEMLVMGYATQKKKETPQSASKELSGNIAGLARVASASKIMLKGKVVSADDGQPLPGVSIQAGDDKNVSVTDGGGNYIINVDSLNTNITYNYIGFRPQKLNARGSNTGRVALEADTRNLNEVVIVNPADAVPATAHPKNGWENYQKYLNANSVSPNGKSGIYRVSFTVGTDGSLSNFDIGKAENDIAGQKAIQLIKNGPEWVGAPRSESKKITVTVKLRKGEK